MTGILPRPQCVKGPTYVHPQFQTYLICIIRNTWWRKWLIKWDYQSQNLHGNLAPRVIIYCKANMYGMDGTTARSCVAYEIYMISIAWCTIAATPVPTQWGKHKCYIKPSILISIEVYRRPCILLILLTQWGRDAPIFLSFRYFLIFPAMSKHVLDIEYHVNIDSCRRSSAPVIPIKYEFD